MPEWKEGHEAEAVLDGLQIKISWKEAMTEGAPVESYVGQRRKIRYGYTAGAEMYRKRLLRRAGRAGQVCAEAQPDGGRFKISGKNTTV